MFHKRLHAVSIWHTGNGMHRERLSWLHGRAPASHVANFCVLEMRMTWTQSPSCCDHWHCLPNYRDFPCLSQSTEVLVSWNRCPPSLQLAVRRLLELLQHTHRTGNTAGQPCLIEPTTSPAQQVVRDYNDLPHSVSVIGLKFQGDAHWTQVRMSDTQRAALHTMPQVLFICRCQVSQTCTVS